MKSLATLSLLFVACSAPSQHYFAPHASDRGQRIIVSVMTEWCDATSAEFCPDLDGGQNDNVIWITDYLARESNGATVAHTTYPLPPFGGTIDIYIDETPDDASFARRIRHELGHAGALRDGHLGAGNAMAWNESLQGQVVTEADARYVTGSR